LVVAQAPVFRESSGDGEEDTSGDGETSGEWEAAGEWEDLGEARGDRDARGEATGDGFGLWEAEVGIAATTTLVPQILKLLEAPSWRQRAPYPVQVVVPSEQSVIPKHFPEW
jgi:hypothetical protein